AILNCLEVRKHLIKNGIDIPKNTHFIAAEHDTTTDDVTLYNNQASVDIGKLKKSLEKVKAANSLFRLHQMQQSTAETKASSHTCLRSEDWAQVRPEWGLARNAAFIVTPRDLTASLSLEGRCFLHSYDYTADPDGNLLTIILT